MPTAPTQIGRYQILNAIGQGGMGTLYKAWDPGLERQIAIKLLRGDDDELRERFAREARSAARLRHPHIVTIFDVGEDSGRPFIAMEFIQGQTLADIEQSGTPIAVARKIELMEALCDGLGFAHKAGIVHRDIKPANIMVDVEGSLKILDFGIARLADGAAMTQAGMLIGTLNYMSPEQITGQHVDSRSDIFAVGLVCYELLAYRQAFPGGLQSGILNKILSEQPPSLASVPGVTAEVLQIIDRAIHKDPVQRYQDLAAMRKDLQGARARLDSGAAPTTLVDRSTVAGAPSSMTPAPVRRPTDREELSRRRAAQIQGHLDQANAAIAAGNFELAIAVCEQALLLDPEEARVLDLLDRARTTIENRQTQAWLTSAEEQLQRGALTSVRDFLDRVAAVDPSSSRAAELRAALAAAVDARDQAAQLAAAVRPIVEQAQAQFDRGEFLQAIASADAALGRDPNSAGARALKARAVDAQRTAEAEAARRARDQRIAAAIARAQAELVANHASVAIETLRALEQTDGRTAESATLLRRAGTMIADAERAAAAAQQAQAHLDTAVAREAAGDLAGARAEAAAALAVVPGHAAAEALYARMEHAIRAADNQRLAEERRERERREAEERQVRARREAEERDARARRETEEREVRERREAAELDARARREAGAAAVKRARHAGSHAAAVAILLDAQRVDPENPDIRTLLETEETAVRQEQDEARRLERVEQARATIEAQIARGEFAAASVTLSNAEDQWQAKSALKSLRQQLKRAQDTAARTTTATATASASPGSPTDRRLIYLGASVLAMAVVVGGGYVAMRRGAPPVAAPGTEGTPPPTVPAAPAPASTPPVAEEHASTAASPPVSNPPTAPASAVKNVPVDDTDARIASLIQNARRDYDQKDRAKALESVQQALLLRPDDRHARAVLDSWLPLAISDAMQARTLADSVGAAATGSAPYADAAAKLNNGSLHASDHPEQAVPLLWDATDLFRRAADEGRAARGTHSTPTVAPGANAAGARPQPIAGGAGAAATTTDAGAAGRSAAPPVPAPAPARVDAAPPAVPVVDEQPAIRALLGEYTKAYDSLNFEQVQKVWPTAPTRLKNSFSVLKSQTCELSNIDIAVTGTTATVALAETVSVVPRNGVSPPPRTTSRTFALRKSNGGWIITDIK